MSREFEFYKKLVWVYLVLLIFEGGLRKWVFPSLSTPLLLVREPIFLYFMYQAIRKGWLTNVLCILMIVTSTISFLFTLIFGHQNLMVDIYGFRIYALEFPFIFIMPYVINRYDVIKMGKFILYSSIPMTCLIILQFYSPQSAWINRGVGGDVEGGGFSGAMGYFRPPATFSFISGYVKYQLLVGSFMLYFILMNNSLPKKLRINYILLYVIIFCYLLTIPYAISRSHFYQSIILSGFALIGSVLTGRKQIFMKIVYAFFGIFFIGLIAINSGATGKGIEVFTDRFTNANESEGKGKGVEAALINRMLYNLGFDEVSNIPFWGYGLGLGTNAGAKMAGGKNGFFSFFNAESENSRILNESGVFLGGIILMVKVFLSFWLFRLAYFQLRLKKDLLPWMLLFGAIHNLLLGLWGQPNMLGFSILFCGLFFSSLNFNSNVRIKF